MIFIKSIKSPHLIIFTVLFILIFSQVNSQKIEEIKIGQNIKGSMLLDEGHKYYKLIIPRNESNRILIISATEDSSLKEDEKDSFSDPDFYISKKNKYPSSIRSSEWYSEQYGSDILTIPAESVRQNDIFYIGIYCQYRCKYILNVKTGLEAELSLGVTNFLHLEPKETMNYKIKIIKEFEVLKVMAISEFGGKFKIFMNRKSPSSANTYKVIPSWESGYVIMIKKGSYEYCINCEYHIIIHNEENNQINKTNSIILYAIAEEKDFRTNIESFGKVYDAMEEDSRACFNYNITEIDKRTEILIIDLVVYSGSATLLVEGWKSKYIYNREEAEKSNYAYNVYMEKFILLDRKDFDTFDQESNYYSSRDSTLHFCIYSTQKISYTIKPYYLSQLNKLGDNHVLMQGNKLRGYLLKDQVINYELFIDNLNKLKNNIQTNITVTVNKVAGQISNYGYFCQEEDCKLNRKNNIDILRERSKLLLPKKEINPSIFTLHIPYNENICLKNPLITLENGNKINCVTNAIIKCDNPGESSLCIYDIQFTMKDTEIIMRQRQVYNGIVYASKTDKYKITINDNNIESLFVVLNSKSGDAQLSIYLEDETSYNKESLISVSTHNDYVPDVIKITSKKIGKENLIGKYIVKIYPENFSSYQVYYYVIYKKDSLTYNFNKKYKMPEINMNLEFGSLMVDYFPNDIRYKIYSYTLFQNKNENIKVFINSINTNFDIYIFNDIFKFEIEQLYNLRKDPRKESIKGYDYKSNSNNEVIISKIEKDFNLNKIIYIVVAPSDPLILIDKINDSDNEQRSKEELNKNAVSKYYIGIITENTPLSIIEGMPHTMTLSESYSHQIYQKYHSNIKKGLDLNINVLLGEIDIFISTEFITAEDIENIDYEKAKYNSQTELYEFKKIRYQLNVNYLSTIELDKSYIFGDLQSDNSIEIDGAYIYYLITRSDSMEKEGKVCQYIVTETTSETKGIILRPGAVSSGIIEVGDKAYYIVEEIEKRKWAFINVIFKRGNGNVYLRIPETPESHKNIHFPNEGNYDYKGKFIYSGRIIQIPKTVFEKLDSQNIKLQFLITITAEIGTETLAPFSDDNKEKGKNEKEIINEVEYSISYSNEPKRINQNEPYDGYISQGEFQYFNFYFDKSTSNIYIGITNMNGDADMYLNKGKGLPTTEKFDWSSTENSHEYIDISKDDEFFEGGKKSISGYYTLLIVGFIDTSYSLFVSTHEKKVFPLKNNIPMACWCENKGEKCLFRYNNVFNQNNGENGIEHNEIIFTSQYLYGSGFMYSKVFIDSELHNSKDFYKNFPDSENYDYSNKLSNQRNYMKMKVIGEKYTKDSSILLTFECNEKTKVDITSTSINHFSSVNFINDNRENIFYLGKNDYNQKLSKLTLIFNNNEGKDVDLIYSIHSYVGDAHFKIYGNTSNWDINAQKLIYDYKLLNEFDLITNNQNQDDNIDVYNPYTHDYHNFISKKDKENFDDIYFYIEPKTEFGFFIRCIFDKSWNKLVIGKSQSFLVVNQELFGYFDITEEYDNIEFSLSVEENLKVFAKLFIKINIIDKNKLTQIKKNEKKKKDEFSLYHYSFPSEENNDYKAVTNPTLGKLSLNLNKLPRLTEKELEKGNKIIRGLFYIKLGNVDFQPLKEEESNQEYNENNNKKNNENEDNDKTKNSHEETKSESLYETSSKVNIAITPGINNFKYMNLKPYEYYFSNLTYNNSRIRPIETKVYELTKENSNHDIMVIEISACRGLYEYTIQEELITKDNLGTKKVKFTETNDKGKKTIYIENLDKKHYYLSIKPNPIRFFFHSREKDNEIRGNDLQYLIYYYTSFSENISFEDTDKWITYEPYGWGRVKLDLPKIITKDLKDNKKEITDYKFDVYATQDKDYASYMMNICYLSTLIPNKEKIFKIDTLTFEKKTNSIILSDLVPGNRFYINILAQNLKTKELITFHPIEIFTGGRRPGFWWTVFRNIFIIALFIFLIIYICKYRKARGELVFLKGKTFAKNGREMTNMNPMSIDSQGIKYSSLGSGY